MKTTKSTDRRNFLLAAGLGGAGVAAAVATGAKALRKPKEEAVAASKETKYRDTEHIRKYYETTKV
jgi:hypothetical protein